MTLSDAEIAFQNSEIKQTPRERIQKALHRYPSISPGFVLLASAVVFGFLNPNFKSPFNISLIIQQVAVVGVVAVGQTLIILTAGIDLSCGAITVFTSMVMGRTAFFNHFPGWESLLLGILVGLLCGAINGFLITKVKLPPFIVTLGTYNIFNAISFLYSMGRDIGTNELTKLLLWTGDSVKIGSFSITIGVMMMILLYAILAYSLRFTAWGRHVYATGDDIEAARLAGIETKRVIFSVYLVAGFIFSIAAWILIGRTQSASAINGVDLNLDSITAVVIGGTSLFGGRGRIVGSIYGAIIVGVFRDGLTIAGLAPYYQSLAVGILVIIAVTIDQWIRKVRN
jgi:fructose transport system permease protein